MTARRTRAWAKLIALSLLAAAALGPMFYTFLSSFSSGISYGLLPSEWSLQGWREVLLSRPHYLAKFWNSMGLSAVIVAGQVLLSCLAGYGFSKFRFRGKESLFFLVILLMMMPYQVTLVQLPDAGPARAGGKLLGADPPGDVLPLRCVPAPAGL